MKDLSEGNHAIHENGCIQLNLTLRDKAQDTSQDL